MKKKIEALERTARRTKNATRDLPAMNALANSLKEMVECYGWDDGLGPIPIIERAVKAIRLVDPSYRRRT